ncbi:MAG TPA: cytochrome c oxidase subunit II [Alphaproteobacteria bacterium]|nr:cytochrome c oxidase subunit II [Alphaproteobacteria bacterium]
MMRRAILLSPVFATLLMLSVTSAVSAATGTLHPGGFPLPEGPTAQITTNLYNVIFLIVTAVVLVVGLPLGYILWRFRASNRPKASTFSHSTLLELTWTTIPALICGFIMWESYVAMIKLRTMPSTGVNVEAVAYQFGWDFYYPDASEAGTHVKAEAPTKPDAALSQHGDRLVPEMVVPVATPIIMHVTSADVLHAFYNPHLGIKIDAIPGRINYAWFQADKPGVYLGQCAELCGSAHAEMFFNVRAVSQPEFEEYIKARRVDAGLPAVAVATVSGTAVSGSVPVATSTTTAAIATSGTASALSLGVNLASGTVASVKNTSVVPVSDTSKITPSVPVHSTGR